MKHLMHSVQAVRTKITVINPKALREGWWLQAHHIFSLRFRRFRYYIPLTSVTNRLDIPVVNGLCRIICVNVLAKRHKELCILKLLNSTYKI